jgi:hypothetical protein
MYFIVITIITITITINTIMFLITLFY